MSTTYHDKNSITLEEDFYEKKRDCAVKCVEKYDCEKLKPYSLEKDVCKMQRSICMQFKCGYKILPW